jgi:hypothetical protein
LQTLKKAVLTLVIVLATVQIIGAEKTSAAGIVLDANGNRAGHPWS